jgi:hypothetical protein
MTEPDADDIARGDGVDALRALEERLDAATRAAEQLLDDAAGGGRPVPAAGWRAGTTGDGPAPSGRWIEAADAELLLALATGVLGRIPTELQQRLIAALREVLVALRALIDWCLERAERRRRAPAEVQDIPIL